VETAWPAGSTSSVSPTSAAARPFPR
jgi:hypothetical protein